MVRRGDRRKGEDVPGGGRRAGRRDGGGRRERLPGEPRGADRDPEPRRGATDEIPGEKRDGPVLDGREREE